MRINPTINFKGYLEICGYIHGNKVSAAFKTDLIRESDIKKVKGGTVIDMGLRKFFIPSNISSTKEIKANYNSAKKSDKCAAVDNPI